MWKEKSKSISSVRIFSSCLDQYFRIHFSGFLNYSRLKVAYDRKIFHSSFILYYTVEHSYEEKINICLITNFISENDFLKVWYWKKKYFSVIHQPSFSFLRILFIFYSRSCEPAIRNFPHWFLSHLLVKSFILNYFK